MEEISPEAYYDALFILNDAPKSVLPISVIEMHLFSYLGCMLALFRGKPIGDWGYSYAITSEGFPFSAQFEEARKNLISNSLVNSDENGLLEPRQPELGTELQTVLTLGSWGNRRPWLRAATECALAYPVGSIRYAIGRTPGVASSIRLGQRRTLLDVDDINLLYDEYQIVRSVLGTNAQDHLSPAVVWLSARILQKEDAQIGI
ncbi:MAG: hypothetical protein V5B36_03180 [Candidatus Accumulibacter sp. UW25]